VENLKPFLLKSVMKQGYPFSPLLFNNLRIPSHRNKTGRNTRNINRKERSHLIPTCRWHDLIPKNQRTPPKNS
jgi:hypothetical protein